MKSTTFVAALKIHCSFPALFLPYPLLAMSRKHSIETVIRAFGLIMDHNTAEQAAEKLSDYGATVRGTVSASTIKTWASNGELVGINWFKFREVADTVRRRSHTEDIVRGRSKEYKQFVEDAKHDLDKLQDIMQGLYDDLKFKPSDLPAIIKARKELEADAEERINQVTQITQVVGAIMRIAAEDVLEKYKTDDVRLALRLMLDQVAEEYSRFIALGGDPTRYEIGGNINQANRSISGGNTRA